MIETISMYNNASDTRDVERHVEAYTDDGRIVGGMGSTENGKEGLRAVLPQMFAMEGSAKRHLAGNHEFGELPDGGCSVSYLLVVFEAEVEPAVVATSWVTDTFRHVEGRWLVAEHRIEIDPSFRLPVTNHNREGETVG